MFKSFLYWLTHMVSVPNWVLVLLALGLLLETWIALRFARRSE